MVGPWRLGKLFHRNSRSLLADSSSRQRSRWAESSFVLPESMSNHVLAENGGRGFGYTRCNLQRSILARVRICGESSSGGMVKTNDDNRCKETFGFGTKEKPGGRSTLHLA